MTLRMMLNEERAMGDFCRIITVIRNGKGEVTNELLQKLTGLNRAEIDAISELIDANPDWTDEEIAEDILGSNEQYEENA